jgi:hypothetical protein
MEEANEKKRNSKKVNYNVYKRCANYKNLEFSLSYEEYVNIVEQNCYYCGLVQEKGFNGIDRKDQTKGYILDNCVSCCQMCNYMKGSCSDEVFIKRVEHILTNLGKINGNLYPECFADHKGASYSEYRSRAVKKGLEFIITVEEFIKLINKNCYICGKETIENHYNGIDRYDNSKGYTNDNVKSCCGECNYMKKNYEYNNIIEKFMLVYDIHKDDCYNNIGLTCNNIIVKGNKKSREEIKNQANIRRETNMQELIIRYKDEEYKKNKSLELAKKRKNINVIIQTA